MKKTGRTLLVILVIGVCFALLYPTIKWYCFVPQTTKDLAAGSNEQIRDYARGQASKDVRALKNIALSDSSAAVPDEYKYLIADAKAEAADLTKAANQKAQAHYDEVVLEAKADAARLMEKAEAQIEQEKKKAMNELKDEISGIAVDIASKVVEREIDEKDHEALISEFIKGVGEAS